MEHNADAEWGEMFPDLGEREFGEVSALELLKLVWMRNGGFLREEFNEDTR